jgi:hypothetical protein
MIVVVSIKFVRMGKLWFAPGHLGKANDKKFAIDGIFAVR